MANPEQVFVGADVGGTNIEVGVITAAGQLLGSVLETSSPTGQDGGCIVGVLADLFEDAHLSAASDSEVLAYGIGIPGPFDYYNGVSWMQHKFPALYGRSLRLPLEQRLGHPIFFVNDANAFGLGVASAEYPDEERLLCVTIGTGLGSGFIVNGRVADSQVPGVPKDGEIWRMPFRDGTLEQRVSKYAFAAAYVRHGGETGTPVRKIIERAGIGEVAALAAVNTFSQDLGEGLALASKDFRPTRIVFGGRISNNFDLYADVFAATYEETAGFSVPCSQTGLGHAAILGAANHARHMLGKG